MSFWECERCGGIPGVTGCCRDKPACVGPDFEDGCDHEGFPGGCERFGHTVETCPDKPDQKDTLSVSDDLHTWIQDAQRLMRATGKQSGWHEIAEKGDQFLSSAAQAVPADAKCLADRLDLMADSLPGSQAASDLYAAATIWRKHMKGPQAQQPASAPSDVERQYKDGVHIGSGLPRESCPCGLCKKYPAQADAPKGEPDFYVCEQHGEWLIQPGYMGKPDDPVYTWEPVHRTDTLNAEASRISTLEEAAIAADYTGPEGRYDFQRAFQQGRKDAAKRVRALKTDS